MTYSPPIKGKLKPQMVKPPQKGKDYTGFLVKSLTEDKLIRSLEELDDIKLSAVDVVDKKIEEADVVIKEAANKIAEANKTIDQVKEVQDIAISNIENLASSVKDKIDEFQASKLDEETITKNVLGKLPDLEAFKKDIVGGMPKFDEGKMLKRFLKELPDNKASLKIIQEKIEFDPMSVIEKIMTLPEGKFKLKSSHIDGLEQTISSFRNQLGRGYLHGGGISNITGLIEAGTNITITGSGTKNAPYVINSSGSSGIASINADTTAAQLLVVGYSGTDFAIADNGTGTHTFNIPTASALNRGLLSSTDWTTFNNKGSGTVTSVSGTSNRITSSGGTTPIIDISASYVGQTSISTLGTVTTGVWQGTTIAVANGGTGGSSASITLFNNITGYTASGSTGTTSTNLVFSTSPTITTASLSGAQQLLENASIQLDPAGSADGKYTGTTVTATAGYTQAFGDLVYLDPTDSRWEACDANSAAGADGDSRGIIGMVVVAGTDGNACTILLNGIIRADAKFPTFTVNNPIYVSETAGAVTQTQPVTTDVVIRILGAALTTDEMYFNPDNTWITHV